MAISRRLRWLHRIGYVTTALVAAELLFVAGAIGVEQYQQYKAGQERRRETAYRDGPFRDGRYAEHPFTELPPAQALAPDGLRFTAQPELMHQAYEVALTLKPNQAQATGMFYLRDDYHGSHRGPYRLGMPAADYEALVRVIDGKLDGFGGDPAWWLDGTEITVERVRGHRFTSGHDNAGDPYHAVSDTVLRTLRHLYPGLPLPPLGHDWYPAR